jgi:hypothetical protein
VSQEVSARESRGTFGQTVKNEETPSGEGASSFPVTHFHELFVDGTSGGGGNCTRSPGSAIICPQCGYDMVTEARPEMGREGAALHELVANWHSLTSSVRAKIVDLLRSG